MSFITNEFLRVAKLRITQILHKSVKIIKANKTLQA